MGDILLNHSYVDLSRVGGDPGDTVKCITDLISCCSFRQNEIFGTDHRGNWFAPGRDTRLPFRNERGDIYEDHGDQESEIHRRNNADMPSGIYRCDIPTNAVHDDAIQSVRESVFVGLYASGVITIYMDLYLPSQLIYRTLKLPLLRYKLQSFQADLYNLLSITYGCKILHILPTVPSALMASLLFMYIIQISESLCT